MDDSWWYMMINHDKHVMRDEWWEMMINDKLWHMMTNYKFMINDDNLWTITIYGCQQPVCYGMGLFCYIHGSNNAANPSSNIQLSICFLVGSCWTHGVYGWTPQLGMSYGYTCVWFVVGVKSFFPTNKCPGHILSGACTVHGSGRAQHEVQCPTGRFVHVAKRGEGVCPHPTSMVSSQPRAQTSDVSSNG